MTQRKAPRSPEDWFRHLFRAQAALDGGVVRRNIRDMEMFVGRERFEAELRKRGFSAVENNGQVVVFCNVAPVRLTVDASQFLKEELTPDFQRKSDRPHGYHWTPPANPL